MIENPRILITNDDGVDAPGIAILIEIANQLSDDVWVVAPDGNQSGAGHRISFGQELSLVERSPRVFAVNGSPADCVVAGYTHLLKDRAPDVVLSGVNAGQNLGDIVYVSGTAAGAREGCMQGAIGIALSQAVDYTRGHDVDWSNTIAYGADVIAALIAEAQNRDVYYNVNFPFGPTAEVSGIRVVPHQRFSRSPFQYYQSQNEGYFFVAIPDTPLPLDPSHDFHLLHHENTITVTPLSLLQTDMETAARLDGKLTLKK